MWGWVVCRARVGGVEGLWVVFWLWRWEGGGWRRGCRSFWLQVGGVGCCGGWRGRCLFRALLRFLFSVVWWYSVVVKYRYNYDYSIHNKITCIVVLYGYFYYILFLYVYILVIMYIYIIYELYYVC